MASGADGDQTEDLKERRSRTSKSGSAASAAVTLGSIRFCNELGLNYVSCSPYRVPVARLAAAQAAMETKERDKERVPLSLFLPLPLAGRGSG